MFSEKSVYRKSCRWGYGVLILLLVMGVMVGCSSRGPQSTELYNADAQKIVKDTGSSTQSEGAPSHSSTDVSQFLAKPVYSSADREVVLRYAEKGESDSANRKQALKLVQRAEQLSSAQRTMEDYLVLAAHYWFKGDTKKVVQYANQGVMSKSDNKRVKALMSIYLGYSNESNSPVMARSYFKQAAEIDPGFYKGHFESGRILYLDKKYSEASVYLKDALDAKPEDANIYGKMGQMFYAMDQYEEAAEALEQALAMSPKTHWVQLQLGDTYFYGLKEREKGGRFYQQAIMNNNSDPEAHYSLALYYRYKNDYAKVKEHLDKAILLDFKNPKYKRELADAKSEKNEIAKGVEKFQRAIAKNPKDPNAVTQLGRFYQRWGKFEQAEEQFKKAVEVAAIAPEAPAPVVDPETGKPTTPAPVKQVSKVPEYANHLGWFYFNDKKYTEAEKAFKSALEVDPKYTEAQFGLGKTYENLEQYDLAASYYSETVASDPKHEEAQNRLTDLKKSDKLTAEEEVVTSKENLTVKKSVMKVRK